MKTLKQIRLEKKKKLTAGILHIDNIILSDTEQDECVKEWLQQKQEQIKNERPFAIGQRNLCKELLEELKQ